MHLYYLECYKPPYYELIQVNTQNKKYIDKISARLIQIFNQAYLYSYKCACKGFFMGTNLKYTSFFSKGFLCQACTHGGRKPTSQCSDGSFASSNAQHDTHQLFNKNIVQLDRITRIYPQSYSMVDKGLLSNNYTYHTRQIFLWQRHAI